MAQTTTTEDIGYVLEGTSIIHIDTITKGHDEVLAIETTNADEIELIEISSINNPVFQLTSGPRFRIVHTMAAGSL